jgi:hypothetical protein
MTVPPSPPAAPSHPFSSLKRALEALGYAVDASPASCGDLPTPARRRTGGTSGGAR